MMGHPLRRGPLARMAMLALGTVVAAALCWAPAWAEAKPTAPQLSIAVDNGHTSVDAGEKLAYTVTVTNLGTKKVNNLLLTQSVPAGAKLMGADAGGAQRAGAVHWKVDIRATGKVVLHSTMTVAQRTPAQLLRLATVACAKISAKGTPIVCASDSDQLPAGALAAKKQAAMDAAGAGRSVWWYAGGAMGIIVVGTVVTAFLVRRRKGRVLA